MHALTRYPKHLRRAKAREWGARGNAAQQAARMAREPDFYTQRKRALHDARGQIVRHGITYHGDGRETQWCVRRSISGRTDQFDIVANGRVWRIGGPRRVSRWLTLAS